MKGVAGKALAATFFALFPPKAPAAFSGFSSAGPEAFHEYSAVQLDPEPSSTVSSEQSYDTPELVIPRLVSNWCKDLWLGKRRRSWRQQMLRADLAHKPAILLLGSGYQRRAFGP